jgi:hypothetical protein
MRECFENLAEQAMVHVPGQTGLHTRAFSLEKFAELIVRECSNKIEDQKATAPPQVAAGLNFAQVIIKEHFGVE